MSGIGTNSPASATTSAMTNSPLMMLPNRRIISEKVRVISDRMLSGSMIELGSAKLAR